VPDLLAPVPSQVPLVSVLKVQEAKAAPLHQDGIPRHQRPAARLPPRPVGNGAATTQDTPEDSTQVQARMRGRAGQATGGAGRVRALATISGMDPPGLVDLVDLGLVGLLDLVGWELELVHRE